MVRFFRHVTNFLHDYMTTALKVHNSLLPQLTRTFPGIFPIVSGIPQVFLVNVTDLYVYNDADLFGVDSWIPVSEVCHAG